MKTHFSFKHLLFIGGAVLYSMQISAVKNPVGLLSSRSRKSKIPAMIRISTTSIGVSTLK